MSTVQIFFKSLLHASKLLSSRRWKKHTNKFKRRGRGIQDTIPRAVMGEALDYQNTRETLGLDSD